MSCVLSYLTSDRVHLFTDRAFYSDDGRVAFFASKCFQIHDQPIVLAGRGIAAATFGAIDAILNLTAGKKDMTAADAMAVIRNYFSHQEPADAEFVMACANGIGARHFVVHLHGRYDYPAFEPFSPPLQLGAVHSWIHMGPMISLPPSHYAVSDDIDYRQHGLEVMDLMRKEAGMLNERTAKFHLIGGGVDYTTVDRDGVKTTRLKDWPDQLGQPIRT